MWWCLIPSALATPPVSAQMHERFAKVTEARDHVVQGRLDDAKTVASLLADSDDPEGLPSEWKAPLRKLRKEAKKTSRAKNLVDAAAGIGEVAQKCGECHASTGADLGLDEAAIPSQAWDEGQNMALHAWASEWMWLGLVGANEQAWQRGARSLLEHPIELAFQSAPAPTDQPQLEQLVYIIAERATTTARNFRGEIVGQLLATCSECHVTERDQPAPGQKAQ